jgi:GNAT superfamily N-acetyltransferase
VSELFVHVAAQGRGIGTLLLEEIKREGLERGCSRLSLLNMRNRESYQRGYYRKVGWEERENAANFVLLLK